MKPYLKTALIFVAMVLITAGLLAHGQATDRYGRQKVVYHINYEGGADDRNYVGALRNIQNHINAVGADNLDLKIVLHGKGLTLLQSSKENGKLQSSVTGLKDQNVTFNVCNNTLQNRKLNYASDLYAVAGEDIVPSGVAELARLQQLGYVYIKP